MLTQKHDINNKPSAIEVFIAFLSLGLTSFGGPAAHIGFFRKKFVEQKKWLSEQQFSQLLAICQFFPGPASSQLGFALGLLRAGWLGAVSAFIAFTLPSVFILLIFASSLSYLSTDVSVAAIHGLKLVACAVVADAVLGMYKNLCKDLPRRLIALLALCVLIFMGGTGIQMCVIAGGGISGLLLCREKQAETQDNIKVNYSKQAGGFFLFLFFSLLITLPVLASQGMLYNIAQAFYQAGALVFGGGHVVLPLLESAIVTPGFVDQDTFIAGYGASQAIPGPMFSFSAYLGALIPSQYPAIFLGLFALFFMFSPGFLLVAGILPFWQNLSKSTKTTSVIAGVNAAVVGLLAAVLYDPIFTSGLTSIADIGIVFIAMLMLIKFKLSPFFIVLWCVLSSILVFWL